MNIRWMTIVIGAASLCALSLAACGDETATGPMFGDLEFTPSFVDILTDRSVTVTLENASDFELGPIELGLDIIFLSTDVDEICNGVEVTISPTTIQSLGPGEARDIDVQFDTSGASAATCKPGKQEAEIPAVVDSRILAISSIRFDWDGTPP